MANKQQEELATDDAVVLMLLSLVEEDGIEVPVTLNVNGVVVSGILIGASAYYEGITESAKELKDVTLSKIIYKRFSNLKEAYIKQKQDEEESDKEEQENSATFIHLKNARYLGKDEQPLSTNEGTWWRGRIASIDGFSFNSLD